jgi:hypothetical protein
MDPIEKLAPLKLGRRVEAEIRARINELETKATYRRHQGKGAIPRDRAELERLRDFLQSLDMPLDG